MTKILVFGTFDILHPGHKFFLKSAKEMGNELNVVIARDDTVLKVKGRMPHHDENQRLKKIKTFSYVDNAYLGNKRDKFKIIKKIMPDIICLGYDQKEFVGKLPEELKKRGLKTKIFRFDKAYKPHIYKSSILRKNIESEKRWEKILKTV